MEKIVDYKKLYELSDPFLKHSIRLHLNQDSIDSINVWELFKGEFIPSSPIIFKPQMGTSLADFLWVTMIPMVCISQKVVDILQEQQISGWSTYSVEIINNEKKIKTTYYGLVVNSYAGKIDLKRSKVVDKPPYVQGGKPWKAYKGIYFDEANWDGRDIFRLDGGIIIVTEKVRRIFKQAKIDNIRMTNLTLVERDTSIYNVMNSK
jgi:hypothetical protein